MPHRPSHRRGLIASALWLCLLGLPWILYGLRTAREGLFNGNGLASKELRLGLAIFCVGWVHVLFAYGILKTYRWAFTGGIGIFILWCAAAGLSLILLAMMNEFKGEAIALGVFVINAIAFDRLATAKMTMDKHSLWKFRRPRGFSPILDQPTVSEREK